MFKKQNEMKTTIYLKNMKSKVVIENGEIEIVLTPENDFEREVLDKIYSNKNKYDIFTDVKLDSVNYYDKKYKLVVSLKEIKWKITKDYL